MGTEANRAREIADRARRLRPGRERDAYVDAACGDDPEMRSKVDQLVGSDGAPLESVGEAGALVSAALAASLKPPLSDDATVSGRDGATFGGYELIREIGRGGFGIVYLAQQGVPVKRQVALKIIKLGMDTEEVVRRFEAERQALALMDHPNIAHVFDAGATETGRPFFVMELVKGVSITEFCDRERLGTRERLDLFMDVCGAVQHAHQKGVIHRDLKPSNVLVSKHDDNYVVKVIDFGIAKATQQELTEQTIHTKFEQFMGTPTYVSPEQAQLGGMDIDTRTDIYSLGVLLYELLTGHTPFDSEVLLESGYEEIRRMIREEEPPRPSTCLSTIGEKELTGLAQKRGVQPNTLKIHLRGDLDWIVMKCLEKDRNRRYETAYGLAADLRRHTSDQPVVARPPSASYRLQKYLQRNRTFVVAAGIVITALVAGTIVSAWQAIQASRAKEQTLVALDEKNGTLADMHAHSGVSAVDLGDVGDALLWFAKASEVRSSDASRENAHKTRFATWMGLHPFPTHTLKVSFKPRSVVMHPSEAFVLIEELKANSSGKRSLVLWNVIDDTEVDLSLGGRPPERAVWNRNGDRLVIASADGMLHFCEFPSLKELWKSDVGRDVYALAFSPDGKHVATGSKEKAVLINAETGLASALSHEEKDGGVSNLAFSPDNRTLATVGRKTGKVRLFPVDASSSDRVLSSNGVASDVYHLSDSSPIFVDDGRGLITLRARDKLAWWDVSTGLRLKTMTFPYGSCDYARLDPRGRYLSVVGFNRTAVWRMDELRSEQSGADRAFTPLETALLQHGNSINGIGFHPRSSLAITASSDRTAAIWSTSSGTCYYRLPHQWAVRSTCVGASGDRFVTAQSDGLVRLWQSRTANDKSIATSTTEFRAVVSADERRCLTLGNWGWARMGDAAATTRLQLIDLTNASHVDAPVTLNAYVNNACFSTQGERVALFSSLPDAPELKRDWEKQPGAIWISEGGGLEGLSTPIKTPSEPVDGLFDPTGKWLTVICAGGELLRVDVGTSRIPAERHLGAAARTQVLNQATRWIQSTPDGQTIVTASSRALAAWNAETLECQFELEIPEGWIRGFEISKDGRLLTYYAFSSQNQVRVLDMESGSDILHDLPHPEWVFSARFAENDRLLVTASRDGVARIWDLESGKLRNSFSHADEVTDALMIGDSRWLITTVRDGAQGAGFVRAWEVDTGRRVMPDKILNGFLPVRMCLLADGRRVTVDGVLGSTHVLDLGPLFEDPFEATSETARSLVAEVLSGKRLQKTTPVGLSTEEWQERWKRLRASEELQFLFDGDSAPGDSALR